eukprot:gene20685-23493_t
MIDIESVGLIDEDPVIPIAQELMLTNEDFPPHYVNMQHPDDYILSDSPIKKELIFHEHKGRHSRLHLRCSVKLMENVFCPMSFVLNTGAPKIYLSLNAKAILENYNLHCTDDDLGVTFVNLLGHRYRTEDTPEGHAPANIIGLKALCRWGITLFDEPTFGFKFAKTFSFCMSN